jgi:hypothetical protein
MARLFLSYRRSDTGAYADRLASRLASFQFDSVFLDREAIGLGDNFADSIRSSLSQCSTVLVLIGQNWIDARDAAGQRRLDDPTDWVRREIALALNLKLPVIPVRFDSPRRFTHAELPPELVPLAAANDYSIDGNYFDRDADYLCRTLEEKLVAAARAAGQGAPLSSPATLLRQLQIIWLTLTVITLGVAVAPVVVPALPRLFWLFPGTMTLAAFLWWLYWLGESMRPARARMA